MNTAMLVLSTMRPKQWVKNLFTFAPLLFALKLGNWFAALHTTAVFALFCLASGTVYLLNDVLDRDADAQHPHKKLRPIASGRLPVSTALGTAIVFAVTAIGIAFAWDLHVGLVVFGFLALNCFYSLKGKRIPIVDVLLISCGFILRVVAGAVAIPVPISLWILVCTFFLSVYLGLGKRLHELLSAGLDAGKTRAVLKRYSRKWTAMAFHIMGALAVVSFTAYTLSEKALTSFGTSHLVFTVPLVILGLFRFSVLARDTGRSSPPTEALLTDAVALASAVAWTAAAVSIIYLPRWLA